MLMCAAHEYHVAYAEPHTLHAIITPGSTLFLVVLEYGKVLSKNKVEVYHIGLALLDKTNTY